MSGLDSNFLFPFRLVVLAAFVSLFAIACGDPPSGITANTAELHGPKKSAPKYERLIDSLEPFFEPMGKPAKTDWLGTFKESGQTFAEYLDEDPTLPTAERGKIYVRPLGKFSAAQMRVINATTDYIHIFYGLPVTLLPARVIPKDLRKDDLRTIEYNRTRQIRAGYILDDLLLPQLPPDAAALIAFTEEDLFMNRTGSFVFGQARLEDRVAVWSLKRLDDRADEQAFLLRAMKIAVHETGHIFGMRHCTRYECVMSGTNNLAETDSRPIDACPECTAKAIYLSNAQPKERFEKLAEFAARHRLSRQAELFRKKALAVE